LSSAGYLWKKRASPVPPSCSPVPLFSGSLLSKSPLPDSSPQWQQPLTVPQQPYAATLAADKTADAKDLGT